MRLNIASLKVIQKMVTNLEKVIMVLKAIRWVSLFLTLSCLRNIIKQNDNSRVPFDKKLETKILL